MLFEFAYTIGRSVSKKSCSYWARYMPYSSGAVSLTVDNSRDSSSLPAVQCQLKVCYIKSNQQDVRKQAREKSREWDRTPPAHSASDGW